MKNPFNYFDEPTRRQFIERFASAAFAVNMIPGIVKGSEPIIGGRGFGKAKRVIHIQLNGGLSHIDTFDPKTGASKGPGDIINTASDFQMTSYLPKTAAIADKICVIRSMEARVGIHAKAQYLMRTAFEQRGTIVHPSMGAWAMNYLGPSHSTMPTNVCINRRSDQGNGFFPSKFAPLAVGDPAKGIGNIVPKTGRKVFNKRVDLMNNLDQSFREKFNNKNIQAYNGFYDDALKLMDSKELKAFDLRLESKEMREAYGSSKLGQGCLLARRLVSSGVRYVEVSQGGWDFHKDLPDEIADIAPIFDKAYAALITDLVQRGMLDDTLVVVSTEFGRKPKIIDNGRGHHPLCFSTVLAGGGIKQGFVYGASDDQGYKPIADAMSIQAFHATIGWAAGLPLDKVVTTETGRPFTIGKGAKPVMGVFA